MKQLSREKPKVEMPEKPEPKQCELCGEPVEPVFFEGTYAEKYEDMEWRREKVHLDCASLEKALIESGVPFRYRGQLEGGSLEMDTVRDSERGVFLIGQAGVGKTYELARIARDCAERSIDFAWVNVPDLLLRLQSSFSANDETVIEIIDGYVCRDVVILDDLGAEKSSDWSVQALYVLINGLYENKGKLHISSNYSVSELAERLGDRMMSRILSMAEPIELDGQDRRMVVD